jgi:glucose-6-phosphate isomerase
MNYSKLEWWERFQKYYQEFPALGLALDLSRMNMDDSAFAALEPLIQKAFASMKALESGAIANPDEQRMVGHYWLRNPALAPTLEIRKEIEYTIVRIKKFAAKIHAGKIHGSGGPFKNLLLIGIGGSALGPQFVSHALGDTRTNRLRPFFFDNTDPDGMDRVLASIGSGLNRTLCIVVSKSGATKETRNGMLEVENAFKRADLAFAHHAVAVTSHGSELDKLATKNKWLIRFPMWDWVGGRTSELSAVGLLPAALQGIDITQLLEGARECDAITRQDNVTGNPSAMLAAAFYHSGNGKGTKSMVVLPYKDRLELFSKYLQQLVMESLGKELDLTGTVVNQGLSVFGNKGATDQHSYVQQLRDGLNNFFVAFIEVLNDGRNHKFEVEPNVTSGDYLHGFFLGTRQALAENHRESVTITVKEISPFSIGMLIALFERAVGLYASMININAYHQPGVEAGKKAASRVIEIQRRALDLLSDNPGSSFNIREIAERIDAKDEIEIIFKVCEHLAANQNKIVCKSFDESILKRIYAAA